MARNGKADEKREAGGRRRYVPALEWLCGLSGAAAALVMIGFLTFEGLTRAQTPADVTAKVVGIRNVQSGIALDIRVTNAGGTTAADVLIRSSPASNQAGEATIDFVPRMSERRAVLIVPRSTNPQSISVEVLGYRDP